MKTLCIECHYAECSDLFIIMLNVVMLSVVTLNIVMLSAVMLNVVAPFDHINLPYFDFGVLIKHVLNCVCVDTSIFDLKSVFSFVGTSTLYSF